LQNGESVVRKVANSDGRLSRLLKGGKTDPQIIDELFMATLARRSTEMERRRVEEELASGDARDVVLRDLFWALLNAKEFSFNH
jgi:hypothetical protein